jgi:preprotein translocase subunit SecA
MASTRMESAPSRLRRDGSVGARAVRAAGRLFSQARGNEVESDLAPYWNRVDEIINTDLGSLSDAGLAAAVKRLTAEARRSVAAGGDALDDLRSLETEMFALVREAARRALGLDPFAVQVLAGLAMARGRVVEMPTGEGKTLAAVFPAALQALAGRGIHVLTFNDYLARRDAAWMGPAYRMLGLSVGCVQEGMSPAARNAAYRCDVTYLTAKEAGFDLLRDGLCLEPDQRVHRPFHMALVDEADSILIDEARIPLVIAGVAASGGDGLGRIAALARRLERGVDFQTDEGARNIYLTDRGIERVERTLGCADLFAGEGVGSLAAMRNALHAEFLLRRDADYIVRNGTVELVDEFTGRVAEKRHWPDGLQAAVEAKEGLEPGSAGSILGSITLQHFLRQYPRLCGMTATAASAADELWDVYGLPVVVVPPNRPCIRIDEEDLVFATRAARDLAVIAEIERVHSSGRPILVGTASVGESEGLAAALQRRGVACRVLNARNDEREAAVVAEAGDLGQVTISTNMAGRGTDIRLGGAGATRRDRVAALGGLYVIGTNRHESVRIDLQLRGRAGRQGDPGSSRFFLSLADGLLVRTGIERLVPGACRQGGPDGTVDAPGIREAIAHAQRVAEGECSDARMRLYEYAEIIERQRKQLHARRLPVLDGSAAPHLLEQRRSARWSQLLPAVGERTLQAIERRLSLLAIDRCWAEHLQEMQMLRDEIHLVALGGRTPVVEFARSAIAAFELLPDRVDDEVVRSFDSVEITADGVDWEAHGLRGPSATWTYLVSDNEFAPNLLRTLASHAGLALWAVILWAPLLFAWGLYLRWRRRKGKGG